MTRSVTVAGRNGPERGRAWFDGSTSFSAGAAFTYVEDATVNDTKTGRGQQIELPATASLSFFAGFAESGGTGPCWVTLMLPTPGAVCSVQVDGTTDVAVGDPLAVTNGSHYVSKHTSSGADLPMVGVALEAETDTPAAQASGQRRLIKMTG